MLLFIFACSFASAFIKSVIPLHMRELGDSRAELFVEAQEQASLLLIFLFFALNMFAQPGRRSSLVATVVQSFLVLFCQFGVHQFVESSSTLFAIHFVSSLCTFVNLSFATAWSVQRVTPLAGTKILSTVCIQLVLVALLMAPSMLHLLVPALAVVSSALLLFSVPRGDTRITSETKKEKRETRAREGVSLGAAALFALVALVGLNGEQLLDARLGLKLRASHMGGARSPLLASHLVTAGGRLAAYLWSLRVAPRLGICLWAASQALRLLVMGAHMDVSSLPATSALIALDKCTGSIAEVALETSLLVFLSRARVPSGTAGGVPSTWLMTLFALAEKVTGSFFKLMLRSDYVNPFPTGTVVALVAVAVLWVFIVKPT